MTVKDIQSIYYDELIIYHHTEKLYDGYIADIPEELLDKEIIELGANFSSGMEYAWIEVYV